MYSGHKKAMSVVVVAIIELPGTRRGAHLVIAARLCHGFVGAQGYSEPSLIGSLSQKQPP